MTGLQRQLSYGKADVGCIADNLWFGLMTTLSARQLTRPVPGQPVAPGP